MPHKAIKVNRVPIHKEFCNCWGGKLVTVKNKPHIYIVDGMSKDTLEEYLNTFKITPTLLFRDSLDICYDQINFTLDNNIPSILQTKTVIPEEILEKMHKVKHSGIHVYIDSLRDLSLNSLDEGFSEVFELQEQLFLAKSLMVFTALHINFKPHLLNILTLYEIIDLFKNCIAHVLVECEDISDEGYNNIQDSWVELIGFNKQDMKRYYTPNVQKRAWEMKESVVRKFTKDIKEYLRIPKITMGTLLLDDITTENRIRYTGYGKNRTPLGMRTFISEKGEDGFHNIPVTDVDLSEYICPKCDKQVFSYKKQHFNM